MTASGDKPGILCAGRLYCDLIFTDVPCLPSLGTEIYAGGFGLHAGGGAFITAAYLTALGHPTALASFVPGPPFSDAVLADMDCAGLDISLCGVQGSDLDPQITVAIAMQGDRAFLTRRSGMATPDLSEADLTRLRIGHVHVGELATLIENPALAVVARAAGATVSLDCGWDDTVPTECIASALEAVDVFLPNSGEVAWLRELGLREPFAPVTVTKKGAAGATVTQGGITITAPAEPARVVDTTGAGDAFNAGFLSAWLAGKPLSDCLRRGNAMGAGAISHRGGFRGNRYREKVLG